MSKPSLVVAAVVFVAALAIATAGGAEGPKPGETLDQTTWQEAESFLPPEILRHYRDGEYRNPVADWPESKYNWPPDFQAATRANEGVPEDERMPNPQNFLTQALILVKAPADLHGTAALTWRYRDADRRDSTWTYVPALRRVRAVSPTNRSDGFLGSDMSQDDGPFFDGKPEDFEWNLKGEVEGFRFAEDLNLKDVGKARWVPEVGAWDADWPDTKFIGYMDPAWKGIAGAPTGPSVLARRRCWVVEGVPRA